MTLLAATKPQAPETVTRRPGGRRRRRWVGALYAAPTAFVVGLFFVVPLGLVAWMSLHHWPLLGPPSINWPQNYADLTDDQLLQTAVWFTVKYTVVVTVLLFALSFGLALIVQHPFRGVTLLRTAYFLPAAVGFASASLLFLGLLSQEIGPLGGIVSVSASPNQALGSAVGLVLWRFAGFNMLILLTGLQAIPNEVYEAAKLDGAGHWRIFFRIILPMSSAPIVTLFILTFINMWNDYFWPFLVATNEQTRVLTVAIGVFRSQTPAGSPDWAGLMAAVLVAALPILILFMIFAKKVVNSIGFSGVK